MSTSPTIIEDTNLSSAWHIALERTIDSSGMEIIPLVITLTDFNESRKIRDTLDSHLNNNNLPSIQTVSETIFPESLYQLVDKDWPALYNQYLKNLPRIKKIDSSNRNGTYFERLIAYQSKNAKINQIEIIISSLKSKNNKRRSKLQASIFDPAKDHTNNPYQGFPCLQHVTFYQSKNGGLVLNSFYAIQYLYRRAYGNWLGLINLGKFVANEVGVEFERFNCFVGVEHLDKLKKKQAQELLEMIS